MGNRGFTLVELLVTITVITVITIGAAYEYVNWMSRYRLESQTKNMEAALSDMRMRARNTNTTHFFVLTATTYQVFQDTNDSGVYEAGTDTARPEFRVPARLDPPLAPASWVGTVAADRRGIFTPAVTIQILDSHSVSDYNCLVLADTRILIGKVNAGVCNAK